MPIKQSAIKALRQAEKRTIRNKRVKRQVKKTIKSGLKAVSAGQQDSAWSAVHAAIKTIDKATQKGVIKKNNASRKKSRLMAKFNAI